ncbi:MAG TPA: hypothetical protein VGP24_04525 [Glaciihabitans sp.]|nr:hypothetical protein [Glaciihabitans sp.]
MTEETPTRPVSAFQHGALALLRSRTALWCAFAVSQVWLVFLNLIVVPGGFNDVSVVYRYWAQQALVENYWVGINGDWVYPIVALVPIMLAAVFGLPAYSVTWLALVVVLNAMALFVVQSFRRRAAVSAGWWWIIFMVCLGPISQSRIDAITVPVAIIAVTWFAARPRVATILLTAATWIKIWPIALLGALVIATRQRVAVMVTAISTSLAIIALALAAGSGATVLSFITQHTGRGLQVESPAATFWVWQTALGVPGAAIYYDTGILTYQVTGAGTAVMAAVTTPLLAVVVLGICALGAFAVARGVSAMLLSPLLGLAIVTALIVVNKVGSPQFISWLAVPIVWGLAATLQGTESASSSTPFRIPAALAIVIAILTQLIYPFLYDAVILAEPLMLAVLGVRNLLLLALLGWSVYKIGQLNRAHHARGKLETTPTLRE